MCLAQGPQCSEAQPAAPRSQVKHSTVPLSSLIFLSNSLNNLNFVIMLLLLNSLELPMNFDGANIKYSR